MDALHRHWTDPDVRRYLWDDGIISRPQVAEIVAESERRFATNGHGLWAVTGAEADGVVGCGGFWEFHDPPRLELVLSLDPEWWGEGLATEACRRLIGHAFEALGFGEVLASTDAPNAASLRLMDRIGFVLTRRATEGGLDTVFYSLPRPGPGLADGPTEAG